MLTLMVGSVEEVFFSIFIGAVEHTKSAQFFLREISIPSSQIHRKCFNTGLYVFLLYQSLLEIAT
jgi:hypothetical protein